MKITPEAVIQQQAVKWFKNNYCLKHHKPRYVIFSVPNGINVPCTLDAKMKALDLLNKTGQLTGASDLIIVANTVIFAECKTPTGTQSNEQIDFENTVKALGYNYILFRSLQEFQNKVIPLLSLI